MTPATVLPISTASVVVLVDGRPLDRAPAKALVRAAVDARIDRPSQCRLTFLADRISDAAIAPGSAVVLRAPDGGVLFDGTVTGVERSWGHDGVRGQTIRATDRLALLRRERRSGAESGDVIEIARRIATRHGLDLQTNRSVSASAVTGQFGETDLAFLRRILGRSGLHLAVRGRVLQVFDLSGVGDVLVLRVGHELWSLSLDQRCDLDVKPVDVAGWSLDDAAAHDTGDHSQHTGWLFDAAAGDALARAITERRTQLRSVAAGVCETDARLTPGCRVRVGPEGELHGPLLVTEVEHRIDADDGPRTLFTTAPVDPEPSRPHAGWTLGEVVNVADPDGTGRVMVSLASHGGQQTHWLPVVLPGLGTDKGLVCLPDVGDRVIVLGQADDPGTGVVLGGILGRTRVPGEPVVDDRTRRTVLRLPGGSVVAIDDATGTALIDNGAGSRLELGPERTVLHAATDLEIAAPGKRLVLRAAAIDMERST